MIYSEMFWRIIILVFSITGFFIALYVRTKKNKEEEKGMICPFYTKCDTVVKSTHATFLGFPVEVLGMLYYGALFLSYLLLVLFPAISSPLFLFILLLATTGAFLFSVYLVCVQAFIIRAWCSWCLFSAGISLSIFLLTLLVSDFSLIQMLAEYKGLFVIMHALSGAIGVGTATVTDVFFFKFLKDYRISEEESENLKTLSQVIWFALGSLVLTGLCLYLPEASTLNESPKFLIKQIIVFVLITNGVFLNLLVQPKLVHISFGEPHNHKKGELHHLRKLAFALGAVSLTSWYTTFILGSLRNVTLSFSELAVIYLSLLLVGIIGSQIFEYRVSRRKI